MTLEVKICGITDAAALRVARDHGAAMAGFIFYPRSPRSIDPAAAGALAAARGGLRAVGVGVDLDDDAWAAILEAVPLDMLQAHGGETPARVADLRARFGLPVIKAVAIAGPEDIARAKTYEPVADHLLFDAKPPKDMPDALPGGNARAFDWRLLAETQWNRPWLLSGGLNADNLATAVATAHAPGVDVSSGVEARPGVKDTAKIAAFLQHAATLRGPLS